MTKQEKLMRLNGVESMTKPDHVQELNAKIDGLLEYMGVTGKWNGRVFEVVKPVPQTGDYTDPIPWAVGDAVTEGLWYYADDKDLPHEAIASGTPLNYYDKQYFDFVE